MSQFVSAGAIFLSGRQLLLGSMDPTILGLTSAMATVLFIQRGLSNFDAKIVKSAAVPIRECDFTASSHKEGHNPHKAMNGAGGWCADSTDDDAYLDVQLGGVREVTGFSVTCVSGYAPCDVAILSTLDGVTFYHMHTLSGFTTKATAMTHMLFTLHNALWVLFRVETTGLPPIVNVQVFAST